MPAHAGHVQLPEKQSVRLQQPMTGPQIGACLFGRKGIEAQNSIADDEIKKTYQVRPAHFEIEDRIPQEVVTNQSGGRTHRVQRPILDLFILKQSVVVDVVPLTADVQYACVRASPK